MKWHKNIDKHLCSKIEELEEKNSLPKKPSFFQRFKNKFKKKVS